LSVNEIAMRNIEIFKSLVNWSRENFSDLAWRKNRSLYSTLVSEIMLQQTTVATVEAKYSTFIKTLKNYEEVANASEENLMILWKGLGYYRRCKNLKKACEEITYKYDGKLPMKLDVLKTIPGIGDYTASALLSIGANKPHLAVDANIERIMQRFYDLKIDESKNVKKQIYSNFFNEKIIKEEELKLIGPRYLNEAFMDLGRTICKARVAYCSKCILNNNCMKNLNSLNKDEDKVFKKNIKQKVDKERLIIIRLIVKDKSFIKLYKKNSKEWLTDQLELPSILVTKTIDEKFNQYPQFKNNNLYNELVENINEYITFQTTITKYKLINYVLFEEDISKLDEIIKKEFNKIFDQKLNKRLKEFNLKKELNISTATIKAFKKVNI
jgi:A/G-specific adenine glycosylase